jgi:biopolymer transport protein ExbB
MLMQIPAPLLDAWQMFAVGGDIMWMLGVVALLLYWAAFAALGYVSRGNLNLKQADQWTEWIDRPELATGRMGEALRYVLHGPRLSVRIVSRRFDEVRLQVLSAVDRRLLVVNTLVAAAPLCGLLGTVTGILGMFSALAKGGGKAGMTGVANGMQEALITTQTGLTIALPGLFIALIVKSKRDEIAASLVRLESLILTTRFPQAKTPH